MLHCLKPGKIDMDRRFVLGGLAGIFASGIVPTFVKTKGLLMPIKAIVVPKTRIIQANWSVNIESWHDEYNDVIHRYKVEEDRLWMAQANDFLSS